MKKIILILALILSFPFYVYANEIEIIPSGIVYGPKAAFQIHAPKGWILNNKIEDPQGFSCYLYIEGSNWKNSETIIYTRMAPPEYSEVSAFTKFAINFFKNKNSAIPYRKIKKGRNDKGFPFVIIEYDRPGYSWHRWIAYLQLPEAVAYVVYTSLTEKNFKNHLNVFDFVIKTLEYKREYINYKE